MESEKQTISLNVKSLTQQLEVVLKGQGQIDIVVLMQKSSIFAQENWTLINFYWKN